MAKPITGYIKLQIPAGNATPAPPVGPALGQHGVNIMEFCKAFNARTQKDGGLIIPVVITVFKDKSFTFITKTPPAAVLLKKALSLAKASGEPNRVKVGRVSQDQLREIAQLKKSDLNAASEEAAMRMIAGTARSMGIDVFWFSVYEPLEWSLQWQQEKKYRASRDKVDAQKLYSLAEGVTLACQVKTAAFDESLDVAMRLGVDPKHADQMVRGFVVLPNGTGRTVRVLALTKGDKEAEAREAGADYVGVDEFVPKIQEGWLEFDAIVATPDVMSQVGRLGKVLGPRGLMPSPKTGGVTMDIGKAVKELKAGKVEFRVDKSGNIHSAVGRTSFDAGDLLTNARAFIESVIRTRPSAVKGQYVRRISLATTMGPGIKIDHGPLILEFK